MWKHWSLHLAHTAHSWVLQTGTTTIKLCSQIYDLAGWVRADGCYEGMEIEAEPAIFRAKLAAVPAGTPQCTSSSEQSGAVGRRRCPVCHSVRGGARAASLQYCL